MNLFSPELVRKSYPCSCSSSGCPESDPMCAEPGSRAPPFGRPGPLHLGLPPPLAMDTEGPGRGPAAHQRRSHVHPLLCSSLIPPLLLSRRRRRHRPRPGWGQGRCPPPSGCPCAPCSKLPEVPRRLTAVTRHVPRSILNSENRIGVERITRHLLRLPCRSLCLWGARAVVRCTPLVYARGWDCPSPGVCAVQPRARPSRPPAFVQTELMMTCENPVKLESIH